MVILHQLFDGLLEILSDNNTIDPNVVFQDMYYGRISYKLFAEVIDHLINEGYAVTDEKNWITITEKGCIFLKNGGYSAKIQNAFIEKYNEHETKIESDKVILSKEEYLGNLNLPLPDEEQKRKARGAALVGFIGVLIYIIIKWMIIIGTGH